MVGSLSPSAGAHDRGYVGGLEQGGELVNSLKLPCLLQHAGDPLYIECRSAILMAFGKPFYESLSAAAAQFLSNPSAR